MAGLALVLYLPYRAIQYDANGIEEARYIESGHTNSWDTFTGLTVDGLKRFEKKMKAKSSNTH